MNRIQYFKAVFLAACFSAIAPITLPAQDSATGETAKLVAVVNSTDASVFDKAKACQRLSIIGDESAVPVLGGLLADEKLSAYARDTLEAISGRAADAALREALSRLEGKQRIGILGSIGARRDAEAIGAVAELLGSDDAATVEAAARTLGHIGTPEAADILQKTLSEATAGIGPAIGKACLICIQRLAKEGAAEKAVALCDAVEKADLPEHIRLAATSNAILTQGKGGLPRLIEQLKSDDEARFRLGLHAARLLDVDASAALVAQFKTQPPARQVLLLVVSGDLGNKTSLPTVLEAAKTGDIKVRVAAIRTLAKLNDATAVPVLLAAATDAEERIAAAARSTLALLDSDEINTAIVGLLESDDAQTRQMAIDVAAQRKIASAAPTLLKMANSTDPTVRTSAVKALGSTARLEDLSDFIALAVDARDSNVSSVVQSSLRSACVRMPQEECAERLAAAMPNASPPDKVLLLEQLTSVGGTTALKTVVAAARSNDDAMQPNATRLLGVWLTADAAPALFDLAETLPEGKYQIRALRGYIRIARQLNMTPEERMTVCRNVLAIAERSDDKLLVLEVLKRYPTQEGLNLAASLLSDKDLQRQACSTIVAIGGRVAMESPEQTEKALLQVLELTTNSALKARAEKTLTLARDGIRLKQEEGALPGPQVNP